MCEENMNNTRVSFALVGIMILFCSKAMGLESDGDQPITIDSNSATYNERKGTSTYVGNVISVQGSMTVRSSKLIAYLSDGDVVKLVWTGSPVRFKQKQDGKKEDLVGKSLRLEYFPDKSEMVLIDKAVVTQGNNTYNSDLIKYNSKTSMVRAGNKKSDSQRVHVVLKPKKKKNNTKK
jgi:lipopolysaccharide export system protein LptA